MKTIPKDSDPILFLNSIQNEQRRLAGFKIFELMKMLSGHEPKM
jgi:hypothetical protein